MSRSRSPCCLRSWARTASTSSAIRRSLNSPIEKYYRTAATSAAGRNEIKRQREYDVHRHQLQSFHPVALAIDHDNDGGEHGQSDGRDFEPVEQQRHRMPDGK